MENSFSNRVNVKMLNDIKSTSILMNSIFLYKLITKLKMTKFKKIFFTMAFVYNF